MSRGSLSEANQNKLPLMQTASFHRSFHKCSKLFILGNVMRHASSYVVSVPILPASLILLNPFMPVAAKTAYFRYISLTKAMVEKYLKER